MRKAVGQGKAVAFNLFILIIAQLLLRVKGKI